jgi:alcohol dehydrogenase class IV
MLEVLHKNLAVDDGRFGAVAERLIGPGSGPDDLADFFLQLYERLEITSHVKKYIPDETSLRKLIDEMITPGRADNNLAAVTREDVLDIVTDAYRR